MYNIRSLLALKESQRKRKIPIGTEKIKMSGGRLLWMVKVGFNNRHGGVRWKAKHILLLEKLLCRKLNFSERQNTKFIDGDSTNCTLKNLVILGPYNSIDQCKNCPRTIVVNRNTKGTGLCRRCSNKIAGECDQRPRGLEGCKGRTRLTYSEFWYIANVFQFKTKPIAHLFGISESYAKHIRSRPKKWEKWFMGTPQMKAWKVLEQKHTKLRKEGMKFLFLRAKLLTAIFADPDFQKDLAKQGKVPKVYLDSLLDDTCMSFTELTQLLKLFPRKVQWTDGSITEMRGALLKTIQSNSKRPINSERLRVTLKEFRELENKYKEALALIEQLQSQLVDKERVIKAYEQRLNPQRKSA